MTIVPSTAKDLSGRIFERLTVVEYAGKNSGNASLWNCKCECDGKIVCIVGSSLSAGRTKSCGCLQKEIVSGKHEEARAGMIGKKFGRLEVIGQDSIRNNNSYLQCKCECGTVLSVKMNSLNSGSTQSCGCYNRDRSSVVNLQRFEEARVEMIGQVFGRLTVVGISRVEQGHTKYSCLCSCGTSTVVNGSSLRGGGSQSCGCLNKEKFVERNTTHDFYSHYLYNTWNGIIQRCDNPNTKSFKNYGGREENPIDLCDEWRNCPHQFAKWAEENGHRPGLTIERIDNNKGYSPSNCRIATRKEQNRNTRANVISDINMADEIRNDSRSIKEISDAYGISDQVIRDIKNKKTWMP